MTCYVDPACLSSGSRFLRNNKPSQHDSKATDLLQTPAIALPMICVGGSRQGTEERHHRRRPCKTDELSNANR